MKNVFSQFLSVVDKVVKPWLNWILAIEGQHSLHGLRVLHKDSICWPRNGKYHNRTESIKPFRDDLKNYLLLLEFQWSSDEGFTDLIYLGFSLGECKLVQGLQCVDPGYLFEGPGLLIGHVGGLYRGLGDCGYTSSPDNIPHESVKWKHDCDITHMSELARQLFFFVVCTICTVNVILYKNCLLLDNLDVFCYLGK